MGTGGSALYTLGPSVLDDCQEDKSKVPLYVQQLLGWGIRVIVNPCVQCTDAGTSARSMLLELQAPPSALCWVEYHLGCASTGWWAVRLLCTAHDHTRVQVCRSWQQHPRLGARCTRLGWCLVALLHCVGHRGCCIRHTVCCCVCRRSQVLSTHFERRPQSRKLNPSSGSESHARVSGCHRWLPALPHPRRAWRVRQSQRESADAKSDAADAPSHKVPTRGDMIPSVELGERSPAPRVNSSNPAHTVSSPTLWESLCVVGTTPAIVFGACGQACEALLVAAGSTFFPKMLELQYALSAGTASMMAGGVVVVCASGGMLFGGFLMKHLQASPEQVRSVVCGAVSCQSWCCSSRPL